MHFVAPSLRRRHSKPPYRTSATDGTNGLEDVGASCNAGHDSSFEMMINYVLFVCSWIQKNYPTYYNKFREYSDPAAVFVWEKLVVAGTFIADTTKPARNYLNKKIPELLEKVRCWLSGVSCCAGKSWHWLFKLKIVFKSHMSRLFNAESMSNQHNMLHNYFTPRTWYRLWAHVSH